MSNIQHVELSDTFNKQRETINALIDAIGSGGGSGIPGEGLEKDSQGRLKVKITGDGLSFDSDGHLVGNDSYPNVMTQVLFDPSTEVLVPTVTSNTTISFPAFKVIFDSKVYYGMKISDFNIVNVPTTTMTVESGDDGAVFVYVDTAGEIHQSLNRISPGNSSTQCLLGSYFRLNNKIQLNSWAYTPWNGSTDKERRFTTNGSVSGGSIEPISGTAFSRSPISIILEGVNVENSVYLPNSKSFQSVSPYITKKLWPGYDASESSTSTIDTTHIYNITTQQVDDISDREGYIALVPGIVGPTGQDVYLMAMSEQSDTHRATDFKDMFSSYVAQHITGFTYAEDKFVGITDRGGVTTSQNGFNWSIPTAISTLTPPTSGYNDYWKGLVYDGTRLVTVSTQSGEYAFSKDGGEYWFKLTYSEDFQFSGNIFYLDGKVVTTGSLKSDRTKHYIMILRTNGSDLWDSYEFNGAIPSIIFNNGTKYIGITITGLIYSSLDLITWTQEPNDPNITTGGAHGWMSAISTGTDFLLIGNDDVTDRVSYSTSTDGLTWSEIKPIDHFNKNMVFECKKINDKIWIRNVNSMCNLILFPYTQIFDSMKEAEDAIYNLQFDLGNVASRVNWLGQTIIAKIGCSNYTDSEQLKIIPSLPYSLGVYGSESSGGGGSRVSGITIKSNGAVIGETDKKTVLNFDTEFTILNTSEDEVHISSTVVPASQSSVNSGVDNSSFVTPLTLKNQNYLATKNYVSNIQQQKFITEWPSTTSLSDWPHTIIVTLDDNYTMPTTMPLFTGTDILTWEVLIKNTSNVSITLTWPSIYQPFNDETLPNTLSPNSTIFMMMRKYTNNFTLVSTQGLQNNELY